VLKFFQSILFILQGKAALLRRAGKDTLKEANTVVQFSKKFASKLSAGVSVQINSFQLYLFNEFLKCYTAGMKY
jgi:hypothetical protein